MIMIVRALALCRCHPCAPRPGECVKQLRDGPAIRSFPVKLPVSILRHSEDRTLIMIIVIMILMIIEMTKTIILMIIIRRRRRRIATQARQSPLPFANKCRHHARADVLRLQGDISSVAEGAYPNLNKCCAGKGACATSSADLLTAPSACLNSSRETPPSSDMPEGCAVLRPARHAHVVVCPEPSAPFLSKCCHSSFS